MEKDPATVYLYIRSVVKDASHICHNIFIHRFLSETRPAAHHDDYVSHGLEMTGGPGRDSGRPGAGHGHGHRGEERGAASHPAPGEL